VNESLRIDGRCSQGGDNLAFHYELGDGRTKDGQAFVTAIWPSAGTYTLTLTVSRDTTSARVGQALEEDSVSREIRVEEPPEPPPPPSPVTADFTARNNNSDFCEGRFDGSSSTGDVVRYLWELDLDNAFTRGVIRREGKLVIYNWEFDCVTAKGDMKARLTVVGRDGGSDSVEKQVNILNFIPLSSKQGLVESSFASEISQAKAVEGQVVIEGGRGFPVSADAPTRIQFASRRGRVSIEAVATSATAPFLWRFDFSGAKGFVPGSLRTVSGQEVSRDAYSVVLRFSGAAFERARFEYRLEP
jgi:hypothetical protein